VLAITCLSACGGGGGGSSLPASAAQTVPGSGVVAVPIAGATSTAAVPLAGAATASPKAGTTAVPAVTGSGSTPSPAVSGATATASPIHTVAPTAAPAIAVPTAAPTIAAVSLGSSSCGAVPALTNGVEYGAGWAPYSCQSSPWNVHVSSNPTYATYSSAQIAAEFSAGETQPVREQEAGAFDYGHPIYYAQASDPVVNVVCQSYCNRADSGGYPATIHVPAKARPAGGSDAHMSVIQPDGTEIDMWGTKQPSANWSTGNTVSAAAVANCGSFVSGSGFMADGPGATAGGGCLAGGLLRASELLAGSIDHALFLIAQCANGWQYPAYPNASTDGCTGGSGPPLGGRLWYDVPDATTNATPGLQSWEKAILNALHDYGGYLEDDMGGGSAVSGIAFLAESGESSYAFGLPDPFAALTSQGWSGINVAGALALRYIGADPWQPAGVNFAAHLHWLDPCSAHASC
jgi:hypothetical protein